MSKKSDASKALMSYVIATKLFPMAFLSTSLKFENNKKSMRKTFRSNLKGVGERWVSSVRKIFPFEVILVSFHAIKIYFLCVVREHTFLFILCSSCSGLDYATHIRVWLPKITMIPPFKSFAFYPKKIEHSCPQV